MGKIFVVGARNQGLLQGHLMDRVEALGLMCEVSAEFKGTVVPRLISLDRVGQGYQLKLKCELDSGTREVLRALVLRRGLRMDENSGVLIIRR
jgi:hypothetical protein